MFHTYHFELYKKKVVKRRKKKQSLGFIQMLVPEKDPPTLDYYFIWPAHAHVPS